MNQTDRAAGFTALCARARACRLCPTMEGRRRVLGPANGPIGAAVMFVAEAPGRFGAERTGVPFSGDQSGRNFTALLAAAGWRRSDVFVTNAVLCNPRDARGHNRPPAAEEIANCRPHLTATLEIVGPKVVVALGQQALKALGQIEPHGLVLARDVGRLVPWKGGLLVALYHPSPRARLHRSFERQLADFRALRSALDAIA